MQIDSNRAETTGSRKLARERRGQGLHRLAVVASGFGHHRSADVLRTFLTAVRWIHITSIPKHKSILAAFALTALAANLTVSAAQIQPPADPAATPTSVAPVDPPVWIEPIVANVPELERRTLDFPTIDIGAMGLRLPHLTTPINILNGRSVALSPDGKSLYFRPWDADETLATSGTIWDVATGAKIATLPYRLGSGMPSTSGTGGANYQAAFSGDGRLLATVITDFSTQQYRVSDGPRNKAYVWDVATGTQIAELQNDDTTPIVTIAFSPDGRRLITTEQDATVEPGVNAAAGPWILTAPPVARIWDAATGVELMTLAGHTDALVSAGFSRDGRLAVTASWDGTVRIWDASTGQALQVLVVNPTPLQYGTMSHSMGLQIPTAAFSPDGRLLATGMANTVRVWDLEIGVEVAALLLDSRRGLESVFATSPSQQVPQVRFVEFTPDGRNVLFSLQRAEELLLLWNPAADALLRLEGPVSVGLDGRNVLSADGSVLVDPYMARIYHVDFQALQPAGQNEDAAWDLNAYQTALTAAHQKALETWQHPTRCTIDVDGILGQSTLCATLLDLSRDGRVDLASAAFIFDQATARLHWEIVFEDETLQVTEVELRSISSASPVVRETFSGPDIAGTSESVFNTRQLLDALYRGGLSLTVHTLDEEGHRGQWVGRIFTLRRDQGTFN